MKIPGHRLVVNVAYWFLLSQAGLHADALDSWHLRNELSAEQPLTGVAYGNGVYVAVGRDGILTSLDGAHWTVGPTNRDHTGIVFGGGRFVVIGLGPSLVSTNGTDWTEGDWGLGGNTPPYGNGLTHGNGLFVAVGAFGGSLPIYTSPDGLTWTPHVFSPGLGLVWLVEAAYGNGVFLVVGIRFGAGSFGANSVDGIHWTLSTCCHSPPFHVTFGNGLFTGADVYGSILSSPDGTNWITQFSDTRVQFNDVGFANGVFGAVGDSGVIHTSFDGVVWTPRTTGSSNTLYGFAGNDSSFIAVGDAGTILQSDDTRPRLSRQVDVSAIGFAVSVTGGLLRNYRLQASDRLPATEWVDLVAFTNTLQMTNFVDTTAPNADRRFYRVISP